MGLVLCWREIQHGIALGEALAELASARQAKARPPSAPPAAQVVSEARLKQLRGRSTQQLQELLNSRTQGTARHDWTREELTEALALRGKAASPAR